MQLEPQASTLGSHDRVVQRWSKPFHFRNGENLFLFASAAESQLYSGHLDQGPTLELFAFNKDYVDQLRNGEPAIERHFVAYFGQMLGIMLRARCVSPEKVDDIRQETLARVVATLRREGGIRQPEKFGAFVNSICKNVLREEARSRQRDYPLEDDHLQVPDKMVDLERALISAEAKEKVREILAGMKQRDRELLRAIFLEEKDKDEVCKQYGVGREYLRVLLYRAKERFRSSFEKGSEGSNATETAGGVG